MSEPASTIAMRNHRAACKAAGVCFRCPKAKPLPVYRAGRCETHYAASLKENSAHQKDLRDAHRKTRDEAPIVRTDAPPPPVSNLPAWLRGDTAELPKVGPPLRRPM